MNVKEVFPMIIAKIPTLGRAPATVHGVSRI